MHRLEIGIDWNRPSSLLRASTIHLVDMVTMDNFDRPERRSIGNVRALRRRNVWAGVLRCRHVVEGPIVASELNSLFLSMDVLNETSPHKS